MHCFLGLVGTYKYVMTGFTNCNISQVKVMNVEWGELHK